MTARGTMKSRGEQIGKHLYGATLTNQGRGFYVCLELLALVRGTFDHSGEVLPERLDQPLVIRRRSHDFARRLMGEPQRLAESELAWLGSETTVVALAALIHGLRVPIPGRYRRPKWLGEHLSPFIGDLVHYDAAERVKRKQDVHVPEDLSFRVNIERYTYRGAGGLAHKILRTDSDTSRLEHNRAGLQALVGDAPTPLGNLFRVLLSRDLGQDKDDRFEEKSEFKAAVSETRWVEWLRTGVCNISSRRDLPVAKRVEALMHWVPYCIARHQLELSEARVDAPRRPIPVDYSSKSPAIRRVSRETLSNHHATIIKALEDAAREIDRDLLDPGNSKTWRDACRSFFSGTLGTVGALNAMTGQRFYTASPEFTESVVLASLEPGQEMAFEQYCRDVLLDRYDLVVDRSSAIARRELGHIDRSSFEDNGEAAADSLRELGLLQDYSDMTRMVKGEVQ